MNRFSTFLVRHAPPFFLALAAGCSSAKPGDVFPPEADSGVDWLVPEVDAEAGPPEASGAPDVSDAPDVGANDADAPVDEPCASDCAGSGAFRCSTDTQVQVCTEYRSCLRWTDVGSCAANQVCCNGACSVADVANCYQCGRTCSYPSPLCVGPTRSCGCSENECRARGDTCNTATGRCVRAAVYVDQAARPGGDGSPAAPFQTITEALAAVSAGKTKDHVILVAAGTYANGEKFPLLVRGGVSLEGAGSNVTKIQGVGRYDIMPGATPFEAIGTSSPMTTFVVGDATATNRISGFGIASIASVDSRLAFLCDGGNLNGSESPDAVVEPNTLIDDVVIDGYVSGIFVTSSNIPAPTGCNVRITRSTFRKSNYGLVSAGCEDNATFDKPINQRIPVRVDLGDGSVEGGNVFSQISYHPSPNSAPLGATVIILECTQTFRARYNSFKDSDAGIYAVGPSRGGQMNSTWILEHNTFDTLQVYGMYLWGGAIVVRGLTDNTFHNISSTYDNGSPCSALELIGSGEPGSAFPRVLGARRNQFVGNDCGVLIRTDGPSPISASTPLSDFGTALDPGDNVFACNSSPWNRVSGDVFVQAASNGSVILPFAHNHWDHAVPTQSALSTAVNGTDIVLPDQTTLSVDATPGAPANVACPSGRVRGARGVPFAERGAM